MEVLTEESSLARSRLKERMVEVVFLHDLPIRSADQCPLTLATAPDAAVTAAKTKPLVRWPDLTFKRCWCPPPPVRGWWRASCGRL